MRQTITILCVIATCSSFALTGCSQNADNIPVYQYGLMKPLNGSLGMHTVKRGDTLWSISQSYDVNLRDLLEKNKLVAPYRLKSGSRLLIPAPSKYKVRAGDTLYKVSRIFETTTTDVASLNKLKSPYALKIGQVLRIPSPYIAPKKNTVSSAPKEEFKSATVAKVDKETLPEAKVVQLQNTAPNTANKKLALAGKNSFIKPVSGKVISRFGPKADGLHNDGINIQAPRGSTVRVADKGVVVHSGNEIEGYGNMVLVRHANGYLSAYAHMDKSIVKKGDVVSRGQAIGTVGATGSIKTPQLHFEIRKGRDAINPETII